MNPDDQERSRQRKQRRGGGGKDGRSVGDEHDGVEENPDVAKGVSEEKAKVEVDGVTDFVRPVEGDKMSRWERRRTEEKDRRWRKTDSS